VDQSAPFDTKFVLLRKIRSFLNWYNQDLVIHYEPHYILMSADGPKKPLKTLFKECVRELTTLSESTIRQDSDEYQTQLKELIQKFLDLKTTIQIAGIFSDNESIEEVSTSEIQMLSLDYHLSQLYSQNTKPSKVNNLKKSILLILQFLRGLSNYGLLNKSDVDKLDKLREDPFEIKNLHENAMMRRDEKIANYKLEKQLTTKLEYLNKLQSNEEEYNNADEDEIRSLFVEQLKLFTIKSFDNIRSITQELEILQNIPEPRFEELKEEDDLRSKKKDSTGFTENLESLNKEFLSKEGKILKPFTIVKRDDLKKKVFGTGQYLPTMTVEDYLEQELANGGMVTGGGNDGPEQSSDEDDEEKNDMETYKARQWDEFTESHAKGSGNTMNRG